jgi:Skp family chaperone for outer membrane proteins
MKKAFSCIILILNFFISNAVLSNESIYYIDMQFIMNNSLAGKSIVNQLEKKSKSLNKNFKKTESNLKKEDTKIVSQKNVISKSEFSKKVSLFNQNVSKYQVERRDILNELSKQKVQAQNNLIQELTPILSDYAKKNKISFILPKQNIIIGKSELDLTKNIITILDKKIKSIKLK